MNPENPKPLFWVGSSREHVRKFPEEVRADVGFALWSAQRGGRPPQSKPLKGFGGAGVLEVVERHDGDTYRVVYTVRFRRAVYVLHAFQKKSKHSTKTPKKELDLTRDRLKTAELHYQENYS